MAFPAPIFAKLANAQQLCEEDLLYRFSLRSVSECVKWSCSKPIHVCKLSFLEQARKGSVCISDGTVVPVLSCVLQENALFLWRSRYEEDGGRIQTVATFQPLRSMGQ